MKTGAAFRIAMPLAWLVLAGGPAATQTGEIVDRSELKVCADPNNLPYSDEKKEGSRTKSPS